MNAKPTLVTRPRPRLLILGSKEYPFGSGRAHDALPSGGMEKYVDSVIPHLLAAGLDVTVITRHFPGQPNDEPLHGGRLRVVRVPWVNGFLMRNPSFNRNAVRAATDLPFDAILANGVFATRAALVLQRRASRQGKRVPVIARPAGVAFNQPQYARIPLLPAFLRGLEASAYSRADAVVFNSENEKQNFQHKLGFLPARSLVISTGVDVQSFSAGNGRAIRQQLGLGAGDKLVLFVGRLLSVKGADVLVRAAAQLPANVRIAIAGEGPQKPELVSLVRELNVPPIHFVGHQDHLPDWLAAANAYCLPSRSEGLPLALLEAMAAGKPCVVTDIGLPVQNGKTGFVVPSENPTALALGIQKALQPAGKRVGKRAQQFVRANYSWPKAASAYQKLVNELLTTLNSQKS